ncbi:hypothetical protein OCGS_1966 [Oceaniovalibus guishaninsula JLT2003]|uniref:Lipoprotein n=1 Tax=Oceaniovalibus guishaninsula JLT2003 TaxID=1231392 RepID=K2I4Y1_9RHOB|nr:DUF1190 domain-containing protein [Oceaniovalibus guishaninsula]EKE43985.1 hypothetical protein OCGS_1966 [Oceaniovalibus guishaninsula JLT2003]
MKSSAPHRLVLLGAASALALAGCREEQAEIVVFDDPATCEASGIEPDICAEQYAEALAEHAETAPRYDAIDVCEEQHGEGACVADAASGSGGGSIFMPLMAGYLMGQLLSGRGMGSRALVPTAGSGFATTDGGTRAAGLSGRGSVAASSLTTQAASTRNAPPLTRSTVARSGGFGASRTSGGFGAGG